MEKIVKNLTKIASSLDSQNRIKLASKIDKFTNDLVNIKTAQYVGVQGYWIRNERCWSNCYRQKRAESPKKASQVVWQECQNEYVESINNPTSGWEKYAQGTKQIKLSEANKKIIQAEKEFFNKTVAEKVEHGVSPNVAVYYTIEERKAEYAKEQIKLANSMLEFAEEINQKGFKKEAKSLALEANELIKESGFFNDVWEGVKGKGEDYRRMNAAFVDKVKMLKYHLNKIKAKPQGMTNKDKQYLGNQYEIGRKFLQTYENQAAAVSPLASRKVNEIQNQYETVIRPIITSIVTATDVTSLSSAAEQGIVTLDQILQKYESVTQDIIQQEQQEPQQTEPQEVSQLTPDAANAGAITEQAPQAPQAETADTMKATGIWRIMKDYVDNQPNKEKAISTLKGKLTSIINDLAKSQPAQQKPYQTTSGWETTGTPIVAKSYFSLVK